MANNQTPQTGYQLPPSVPLAGARPLGAPCELTITREFEPAAVPCGVYINGQYAGGLGSGESVRCTTALVQNAALLRDASGAEAVIYFAVPSGGPARLVLGAGRFMPEKCAGIAPLSETDVRMLPQAGPGQAFGLSRPASFASSGTGYAAPPPEKPAWAIGMLCCALLFMLLCAFSFTRSISRSYDQTAELMSLCLPLLFGACCCLMARREGAYKAVAAAGMLVGAAVQVFTSRYLLIYANIMRAPPIDLMLRDPSFQQSFRQTMIIAVSICVVSLIVSAAYNGPARRKTAISAWLGAVVLFALRMYDMRNILTRPEFAEIRKLGFVVRFAETAVCIGLFALIIYALCAPKRRELITGTGAKVWFCICILATAGVLSVGIEAKTMSVANGLTASAGIAGYVMLLSSKRAGFPLVLIAVIMSTAAGVIVGLTGYQPSYSTALISLAGLINPLITWLIIRRRWNGTASGIQAPPPQWGNT